MRHAIRKDKQLRTNWVFNPAIYFIRSNNFLRYRYRSLPVPFSSYSLAKIHNFCAVTGRSRGVFRAFGVSRHVAKQFASFRKFFGVKKSSW